MGMFNYVQPECHLPGFPEKMDQIIVEWQTKDLEPLTMEQYRIRIDGKLEYQDYDTEDQSDPNSPPGTLLSLRGIITRVNKRWVPCPFTGSIIFYTAHSPEVEGIEYVALFVEGDMFKIKKLESKD